MVACVKFQSGNKEQTHETTCDKILKGLWQAQQYKTT